MAKVNIAETFKSDAEVVLRSMVAAGQTDAALDEVHFPHLRVVVTEGEAPSNTITAIDIPPDLSLTLKGKKAFVVNV